MKIVKYISVFVVSLFLVGCGGSGGGSGGSSGGNSTSSSGGGNTINNDFSLLQTRVNFKADMSDGTPATIEIQGTLRNVTTDVYLKVDASKTNLISSAFVSLDNATTGKLRLVPASPHLLSVGVNVGSVIVRACKDVNCTAEYSGSPQTVTINYEVTAPTLTLASNSISFNSTKGKALPKSASISMSTSKPAFNYGVTLSAGAEQWLSAQDSWNNTSGSLQVSIIKDMPVGTHTADIGVFAFNQDLKKTIKVTYVVNEANIISLSQENMVFEYSKQISELPVNSLTITSKTPTSWSLETDADWISFSKKSGSTQDTAAINISLNNNASKLNYGKHETSILVRNLSDPTLSIHLPVVAYVLSPGVTVSQATANILDFDVAYMVSDQKNNQLYLTDEFTKRVYQVDALSGITTRYFQFDKTPERMALSPDNSKLYISLLDGEHSSYWWDEQQTGAIGIIDLERQSSLGYFTIDIDPYDLVVNADGKLIVSSGSGQWTNINAYDASTGLKVGSTMIRQASRLSLHPDQQWVFAADTDSSPSDIEKFDISGKGITGLGNSPYHGDHRMDGNVWAAPNGRHVYTRGGDVFLASSMLYVTSLLNNELVKDLAFDADKNRVIVLTESKKLLSYGLADFKLISTFSTDLVDPKFVEVVGGTIIVVDFEVGQYRLKRY